MNLLYILFGISTFLNMLTIPFIIYIVYHYYRVKNPRYNRYLKGGKDLKYPFSRWDRMIMHSSFGVTGKTAFVDFTPIFMVKMTKTFLYLVYKNEFNKEEPLFLYDLKFDKSNRILDYISKNSKIFINFIENEKTHLIDKVELCLGDEKPFLIDIIDDEHQRYYSDKGQKYNDQVTDMWKYRLMHLAVENPRIFNIEK